MNKFDSLLYLVGDEDTGVGLHCRHCDRGGLPLVYYSGIDENAYKNTDVVIVHTIADLIVKGADHVHETRWSLDRIEKDLDNTNNINLVAKALRSRFGRMATDEEILGFIMGDDQQRRSIYNFGL